MFNILHLNPAGVSIRAPARGATQGFAGMAGEVLFQFALPRGERPSRITPSQPTIGFQFALPRGERLIVGALFYFAKLSFNSRSREGSDALVRHCPRWTWGFNSRSREGSDCFRTCGPARFSCFNSRSREGSDKTLTPCSSPAARFNSRSREGSDPT